MSKSLWIPMAVCLGSLGCVVVEIDQSTGDERKAQGLTSDRGEICITDDSCSRLYGHSCLPSRHQAYSVCRKETMRELLGSGERCFHGEECASGECVNEGSDLIAHLEEDYPRTVSEVLIDLVRRFPVKGLALDDDARGALRNAIREYAYMKEVSCKIGGLTHIFAICIDAHGELAPDKLGSPKSGVFPARGSECAAAYSCGFNLYFAWQEHLPEFRFGWCS